MVVHSAGVLTGHVETDKLRTYMKFMQCTMSRVENLLSYKETVLLRLSACNIVQVAPGTMHTVPCPLKFPPYPARRLSLIMLCKLSRM